MNACGIKVLVTAPKVMLAGTTEKVCVDLHSSSSIDFVLALKEDEGAEDVEPALLAEAAYSMEKERECFGFQVPEISKERQRSKLIFQVKDISACKRSMNVMVSNEKLQTDKPIYKPGQPDKNFMPSDETFMSLGDVLDVPVSTPMSRRRRQVNDSECEGDLVFSNCPTACPLICGKEVNETCTHQCISGCVCPEGLYRDSVNGTSCMAAENCTATVEIEGRTAGGGFQCPPKRGTCPRLAEETVQNCTQECQDDYDCAGARKCCPRGCSSICVYPVFPVSQPVPTSQPRGIAVYSCPAQYANVASCGVSCSTDGDCASREMCCTNNACNGTVCLPAKRRMIMCTTV